MTYRHLLLAADFSEHGERVAERAQDLAQRYRAELSLVHVVETLPVMESPYGSIASFDADITERLAEVARDRLSTLADALGIPETRRWLEMGSPKAAIIRIAREQRVDLIILGSHGRHGVGLLLGSTASSVMHHAECDVLAVRLRD